MAEASEVLKLEYKIFLVGFDLLDRVLTVIGSTFSAKRFFVVIHNEPCIIVILSMIIRVEAALLLAANIGREVTPARHAVVLETNGTGMYDGIAKDTTA